MAGQVKGDNIVATLPRSDKGKSLDPTATLPEGTKGESREKVSKKIGMKPRINTFADRIMLTESVKLIKG